MRLLLLPLLLLATGCASQRSGVSDHALRAEAERIAQQYILVDGHIDVPYRLTEEPDADVTGAAAEGDFGYERARRGGLNAPFMSIYIPASKQQTEGAARIFADSLIDLVERIAQRAPDRFAIATSPDAVEQHFREGKVSLPMGMENGAPIETLDDLRHFARRGIRYVTLTHGKDNRLGDSSYDTTRTWGGLSPFGEEVVREMNRLGVMVDISHISDSTAMDVLRLSRAPVIASHSSMRVFTPNWERNMSDDVLRALARNGGVVMINFGSAFLKTEYQSAQTVFTQRLNARLQREGLERTSPEAFRVFYEMRRAQPVGTVADVVAHINHAVQLVGVEHVGLGSDFDGVTSLPAGLTDVSEFPNLIEALLREGYSEEDIAGIMGRNALRVWREVERVARES